MFSHIDMDHSLASDDDTHLSNKSGAEEGPEGHQEVSARDACQVEQRVRDRGAGQDAEEADPLHQTLNLMKKWEDARSDGVQMWDRHAADGGTYWCTYMVTGAKIKSSTIVEDDPVWTH